MKHRALIVGCGRIGVGRGWIETPYVYTHAGAYAALSDRVDLVAVVDSDEKAANWAADRWGVPAYLRLDVALAHHAADIVSICTPPSSGRSADVAICIERGVRGIWLEKPMAADASERARIAQYGKSAKIQVNYIRRFHPGHRYMPIGEDTELWVWAKKDIHTICHFTNLARFWGIMCQNFHYFEMNGPNSYVLHRLADPTGYIPLPDGYTRFFPLGGLDGGRFMEGALGNLLDAVEGNDNLVSPPESAIESERWADEVLKEKP